MSIPTPWTVQHRALQLGAVDDHNNPVHEHGEPHDIAVHAIYGPSAEMTEHARGHVIELVVLAPAGTSVNHGDLIEANDAWLNVERVSDFTQGPWSNPVAGIEIHLTKVEG